MIKLMFIAMCWLPMHDPALPVVTEDSPNWNCATMGDMTCGPIWGHWEAV